MHEKTTEVLKKFCCLVPFLYISILESPREELQSSTLLQYVFPIRAIILRRTDVQSTWARRSLILSILSDLFVALTYGCLTGCFLCLPTYILLTLSNTPLWRYGLETSLNSLNIFFFLSTSFRCVLK